MSRREEYTRRSSSVYSQDSRKSASSGASILGGYVRSASPEPLHRDSRIASSHYTNASLPSSGGGAPARSLPASGYSPASSRVGSRSSSGSGSGGPAPPGHASIMSAYGHSSYGAPSHRSSAGSVGRASSTPGVPPPASSSSYSQTFIDSRPQTSAARGPPATDGSSYSRTFIDSAPQTSSARGPPSSIAARDGAITAGGGRSSQTSYTNARPGYNSSFMADVDPAEAALVQNTGRVSYEKRRGGIRRQRPQ
ncbi:hypothetical protein C7999DRAFT_27424 [Corynascus novoguineensis]|uniref:Uncharacterized protein n=1 Tax=Corynascus novoguineensis TaxID=1126955 RepID=A0AAN7D193_9PEZI|nr:hypothetical protein C7999DRAFT_27424 [Corynascus novoguineensis]